MIKVMIDDPNGWWNEAGNMRLRKNGYIFGEESSEKYLKEMIRESGDDFAIMYEDEDHVYAVVDRIRSIPIFFAQQDNTFYISNSIYKIASEMAKPLRNQRAVQEIKEAAYVTGRETLLKGVYALLPGEYVVYHKLENAYQIKRYFTYGKAKPVEKSETKIIGEMERLHVEVFQELIHTLNGRQAVIPLSGGYDSRLILHMLCTLGYENILCFTYGKERNAEALVSKKMAQKYHVPWRFVPYTPEKLESLIQSEDYKNYLLFSCNGISASHIQDFLAVKELRMSGAIADDAIFIPGHAYDFLAGTHISKTLLECRNEGSQKTVIREIISKNYTHKKANTLGREAWIANELGEERDFYDSVGMYHFWEWQERQAKYIANAVRAYEYFGYEWKLPFWDKRLIEFWDQIPAKMREDRYIFFQYMKDNQLKGDSSNDRKFMGIRKWMPVKLRLCLYRIKELRNNPLEFYSIFNTRQRLRFVLGQWDFIEKIVEDDLKVFWKAISGAEK